MHNLRLEQGPEHSVILSQKWDMWHLHLFGPRKRWAFPTSWTVSCQQRCGTGRWCGVPGLWLRALVREDLARQCVWSAGSQVGSIHLKGRYWAAWPGQNARIWGSKQTLRTYKQVHRHLRTPSPSSGTNVLAGIQAQVLSWGLKSSITQLRAL